MNSHAWEPEINVRLAQILSRLGIDSRAERPKDRVRPDIRCYCRGLIVGIEASYSATDAERDAERRLEQGLLDVAIALHIKEEFRDVSEHEIERKILKSKYDAKVLVPEELRGTLLQFLEDKALKAKTVAGWFRDLDIPTLKTLIERSAEYLASEEDITRAVEEVKATISDFVNIARSVDNACKVSEAVYNVLYKLYGMSFTEARDTEVIFGQAGLSILLSTVFYEHVRGRHGLRSIADYVHRYGPIEGLAKSLESLLKIDYRTAVEATIEILRRLPPDLAGIVNKLIELGVKISQNRALLERDFAGRVYHEITGDIALRKGFATFYTEIPIAYLLADLAVQTLYDIDRKDILKLSVNDAREIVDEIVSVKVGDLACGSGTLLTASYIALNRLATALTYYHYLDTNLAEVYKRLVEECIYGVDALRYASQVTAVNLALITPKPVSKENVYTIYLGFIREKGAWLGSLELLDNIKKVGGLLAWIEGGLKDVVGKVKLEGGEGEFELPEKFDIIIMNPPFTRATGRTRRKFGERERGLFGFITDKKTREKLMERYREVRDKVREDLRYLATYLVQEPDVPNVLKEVIQSHARELKQYLNIGQAGEGLLFLYLAYKYIDNDGTIAFVLPRSLLSGVAWFLARALFTTKFHLRYVIVSSDGEGGYNFSEGVSLSECLVVAKRKEIHNDDEETIFVNLLRKPKTAFEAIMLAEEIRRAVREMRPYARSWEAVALLTKVKRKDLLHAIDNWNRFVATTDPRLNEFAMNMLNNECIVFGHRINIKVPLISFGELIKSIGLNRRGDFIKAYMLEIVGNKVDCRASSHEGLENTYPMVCGGDEEIRMTMKTSPNAFVLPRDFEHAERIWKNYASRLLVPSRIWWDTTHVTALYSDKRVVANMFFMVRLKDETDEELSRHEKALTLWLNTSFGILSMLINRSETRGRFSSLEISHWRNLPVLNVKELAMETLQRLSEFFDRIALKSPRRIPDQFLGDPERVDPVRLEIDLGFLKAIEPNVNEAEVKEELLRLYDIIGKALKEWIS